MLANGNKAHNSVISISKVIYIYHRKLLNFCINTNTLNIIQIVYLIEKNCHVIIFKGDDNGIPKSLNPDLDSLEATGQGQILKGWGTVSL